MLLLLLLQVEVDLRRGGTPDEPLVIMRLKIQPEQRLPMMVVDERGETRAGSYSRAHLPGSHARTALQQCCGCLVGWLVG